MQSVQAQAVSALGQEGGTRAKHARMSCKSHPVRHVDATAQRKLHPQDSPPLPDPSKGIWPFFEIPLSLPDPYPGIMVASLLSARMHISIVQPHSGRVCGMARALVFLSAISRRDALQGSAALSALGAAPKAAPAAQRISPPALVSDRSGATVTAAAWLAEHPLQPDLVLGLDDEPYFLLRSTSSHSLPALRAQDPTGLAPFALKAECTHLGCLVAPNPLGDGFTCPCVRQLESDHSPTTSPSLTLLPRGSSVSHGCLIPMAARLRVLRGWQREAWPRACTPPVSAGQPS